MNQLRAATVIRLEYLYVICNHKSFAKHQPLRSAVYHKGYMEVVRWVWKHDIEENLNDL